MYSGFKSLKQTIFKNSIHIIDRYHYTRQVTWALKNIRKREQKEMPAHERKYYKRSRNLLIKKRETLTNEESQAVRTMLIRNDPIRLAYKLKETFYDHENEIKR